MSSVPVYPLVTGLRIREERTRANSTAPWGPWVPKSTASVEVINTPRNLKVKPPKAVHFVNGRWKPLPYTRSVASRYYGSPTIYWRARSNTFEERYKLWPPAHSSAVFGDVLSPRSSAEALRHENLKNRVYAECLTRFSSGEVNIGQNLAEARETIHHVGQQAERLSTLAWLVSGRKYRSLRRLFPEFRNNRGLSVSSLWLEYQYAWRPLIGDIYGGIKEFNRKVTTYDQTVTVRHALEEAWSEMSYSAIPQDVVYRRTGGWRYCLTAKVANSQVVKLNQIGLINPLSIAWELVPWSFVVDWLIPVSTYLEACTAMAGWTYVDGSLTERIRFNSSQLGAVNVGLVPSQWTCQQVSSGSVSGIKVSRTVVPSLTLPTLFVNTRPFGTTRLISAAALVRTNLERTRR